MALPDFATEVTVTAPGAGVFLTAAVMADLNPDFQSAAGGDANASKDVTINGTVYRAAGRGYPRTAGPGFPGLLCAEFEVTTAFTTATSASPEFVVLCGPSSTPASDADAARVGSSQALKLTAASGTAYGLPIASLTVGARVYVPFGPPSQLIDPLQDLSLMRYVSAGIANPGHYGSGSTVGFTAGAVKARIIDTVSWSEEDWAKVKPGFVIQ